MKVKLYGGYEGELGSITAHLFIEMPFAPIPGMEIELPPWWLNVAEKMRPQWDAVESVLRVDVDNLGDEYSDFRFLSDIREVADRFRDGGWTVEIVDGYSRSTSTENNESKRGEQ